MAFAPSKHSVNWDNARLNRAVLPRFRHDNDIHWLADCPPSIHAPQTRTALEAADLALIPVQPSPVDLWATAHIAQVVEEIQAANRALRAFLVVNQLEPRTTLSRLIGDALGELDLPALSIAVRRRAVYRNCVIEGRSVYDMGARGAAAVAEIEAIIEEVLPT